MEEGKIGCNHLIIAGILTDLDYARSDFLAMHLEQHLSFTIERHGKLAEQWPEYYNTVLVPLEITSDEIREGATIVYTREGRIVGGYKAFASLMKVKYNITVEATNKWLEEIEAVHEERAKMAIADSESSTFNEKVDAFLKQREESLAKMNAILEEHKQTVSKSEKAIQEIESVLTYLKPTTEALYGLHHYPVKEEEPEKDETAESAEKENPEEDNSEVPSDADPKPVEKAPASPPVEETKPVEEPKPVETEEKQENGEEEEKQENGEEDKGEKQGEDEDKPKEEEEVGEPDPEAVELQGKLQEAYKLPEMTVVQQIIAEGEQNGLNEFITEINTLFAESAKLVAAETRFKWKKFETLILSMNEKASLAANMLKITVISSEQLKIKAIESEIDKYDNFLIDNVDKDVLEAGAIKFAATFRFV